MFSAKILTNRVINVRGAEDVMHSTGYARVKTTDANAVKVDGAKSYTARKSIDEQRKYVRGYKNSRIMNEFYGIRRAQAGVLRTGAGDQTGEASSTRGNRGALRRGDNATGRSGTAGRAVASENPMDTAMRRAQFSASTPKRFGK